MAVILCDHPLAFSVPLGGAANPGHALFIALPGLAIDDGQRRHDVSMAMRVGPYRSRSSLPGRIVALTLGALAASLTGIFLCVTSGLAALTHLSIDCVV